MAVGSSGGLAAALLHLAINFLREARIFDGFGIAGIIDGLRIPSCLDQPLRTQFGKMLRRADWLRPTCEARTPTGTSVSTSVHKIIRRLGFAIAESKSAAAMLCSDTEIGYPYAQVS